MNNLLKLKSILDDNSIKNSIEEYSDEDSTFKYLIFEFPIAREYEEIRIRENNKIIEGILKSNFIKFRGISNYEAIWSSELRTIECEIITSVNNIPSRIALRKLSRFFESEECSDINNELEGDDPTNLVLFSNEQIKVSIGYSSKEFVILSTYKDGFSMDLENIKRFKVTIKIENIYAKTQEEALKLLVKISNSLFYQIDMLYGLTISLSPRRESRIVRIKRRRRLDREVTEIKELNLNYDYDNIPMSLYWLAKNNIYSPIFTYFALYQVLEYYYPIYTTIDIKEKVQNMVKDPSYNINNDSDVLRLLNLVKANTRNDLGDEREQLNLTIQRITSGDEIISFISENQNLHDYYTDTCSKKLSTEKLRLSDSIGIVSDVAKRIYDIRCRIVHNKASEIDNKILPMTKDVDYLVNEVKLLEFISRKAIIANSHTLSLK